MLLRCVGTINLVLPGHLLALNVVAHAKWILCLPVPLLAGPTIREQRPLHDAGG